MEGLNMIDKKEKISFENTEVAFASKTNTDLKRAYWMFKIVASNSMVNIGTVLTRVALAIKFPINWLVKPTIFNHFCGGEDIEDCSASIEQLSTFGIGTILDFSVEGKHEEKNLDATAQEVIKTTHKAKGNSKIPFCVFKVTGVARFDLLQKISSEAELNENEKEEYKRVIDRVDLICKNAFEANTPLLIDAEESWIQQAIDNIAYSMMAKYNKKEAIIYNTLQLYRHDRLAFYKKSVEKAKTNGYLMGMKLVRGAYMEKERERATENKYENPIQPNKEASDRDFNKALEFSIQNIDFVSICAGTHNEKSTLYLTELMDKAAISKDDKRIYFAQLLGMSDHISFNLSQQGYNVAKYMPYGPVKEVMPYLIRRAKENTSVKGQTGRELGLIKKELKRRKL